MHVAPPRPRRRRRALAVTAVSSAAAFALGPSSLPGPAAAPPPASRPVDGTDLAGGKWGDASADGVAKDAYGRNRAERDPGSLFTIGRAIGARGLWAKKDRAGRPLTGQGVAVALLDSGISAVPGLDAPGKVTYGPDLSIEGNGVLAQQDTFGHGTFMAGIIAGRGAGNPAADLPSAPGDVQLGIAPDARLLSLKLATADGSTDVSQVVAALDWVVQHPVLPDGTRVRVVNLSYGTASAQDYRLDPLAAAAENAWHHGIVVVASGGNDGDVGRLSDPAVDPYVVAVGASDSGDRTDGWTGDHAVAASFSQVGSPDRHVDLVAPGTSVVSTRDPGSLIDTAHPSGLVDGDTSGRLFRGSGTSQAAAVVSGAVALLLQAYPDLTPDQVKLALTASADPVKKASDLTTGAGALDLKGAMDVAAHLLGTDRNAATLRAAAVQDFPRSTGQGSLDAARGGSTLVDASGADLAGEVDVQGRPWDPAAWWAASSGLTSWSDGQWLGTTWTGDGWQTGPDGLATSRWSTSRWSTSRWSDADWDTSQWSTSRWSTSRWSTSRWSSSRWSSSGWS
ncbi:S8 family serine peptidase [Lapillicoccus jejuensis]|uniref:Serine protease AprX n=1 Tax=Lapillicoccus jejuensis TaxID=402171 RepID=A0A542E140_9MICO|nr:S8 family serine peptidase [Lapillicoccus jejuensis]TQJ09035.1 serine protease AprX [Lapillicoccus jejuensis]